MDVPAGLLRQSDARREPHACRHGSARASGLVADRGCSAGDGRGADHVAEQHRSVDRECAGAVRTDGEQGGGPVMQETYRQFTTPDGVEYVRILPEIVLTLFGMAIMVIDPLLDPQRSRKTLGAIGLAGALAAIVATLLQAQHPGLGFWDMVQVDAFSVFFHLVITTVTAVVILTSFEYM